MVEAIEKAGYTPGKDVSLALDVAASELFDKASASTRFKKEGKELDARRAGRHLRAAVPRSTRSSRSRTACAEDDWDGWKQLTDELGSKVQLVGDDLFVTNAERLKRGHQARASRTRSSSR